MRHSRILIAAIAAGMGGAANVTGAGAIERQLYDYARERKFPPPETLARKAAEIAGGDFPFASLADAPESTRVFFTAFRSTIEALEPFREDDDPAEQAAEVEQATPPRNLLDEAVADAGAADPKDLVDMAIVGKSLMQEIEACTKSGPLKGWSPAEDPVEIVSDLLQMVDALQAERDKLIEAAKTPPATTEQPPATTEQDDPADDTAGKSKKKTA